MEYHGAHWEEHKTKEPENFTHKNQKSLNKLAVPNVHCQLNWIIITEETYLGVTVRSASVYLWIQRSLSKKTHPGSWMNKNKKW